MNMLLLYILVCLGMIITLSILVLFMKKLGKISREQSDKHGRFPDLECD